VCIFGVVILLCIIWIGTNSWLRFENHNFCGLQRNALEMLCPICDDGLSCFWLGFCVYSPLTYLEHDCACTQYQRPVIAKTECMCISNAMMRLLNRLYPYP